MTPEEARAARELLAFYVEAGVESLVGEEPIDRLAAASTPLQEAQSPDNPAAQRLPAVPAEAARSPASLANATARAPLSPDLATMQAREAAASAATLEDLRAILENFDGCPLKFMAKQLVFADGNPRARLMFVGEAPGREEDLAGLPFVGRSGQLLDRMMAAIGLDRRSAYIANIIPWRPPGNRDPSLQETQICLPFIRRQIELVDPAVLVCLGKPSTAALLGVSDGIKRTRGRWFSYHTGRREIRAIATFHPAYLLRSPLDKRHAWRDMLAIKKALSE
ncbi:MAG TPA: uracil-DNA glycosylase [Xanthobacteraceae bacterium]|nr:uracil-DNA glycosylase [Xanthobacteraceae bacterium]